MMSTFASSVHRLAPPPSVQIFVVSGPWLEPTGSVPFSGGSRKARSSSTAAHSYTISFHSCTLLFSSCAFLFTPSSSLLRQTSILTVTPARASVLSKATSLLRSALLRKPFTPMRPASAPPFISSTRSLGGVQFGDPNPSNITIWAWPIKGYKKKSFRSFYLPVGSSGQSTPLSSLSYFSQEMRAVLPHASVMRNAFPPNTKWRCVSLSIAVCSSCVAVHSGPGDATDVVSTIFRGADWILTSRYKVTKFQASSTAVGLALTHSSHASSSLSFYLRGSSTFSLYALYYLLLEFG
uniref:Uncharacterized protein n=1 Tax=Brassica oleracea TaxID=3712 RepID=A0A3P6GHM5_BRAOL|nr:unnamed protein product [Brassica oleracea]